MSILEKMARDRQPIDPSVILSRLIRVHWAMKDFRNLDAHASEWASLATAINITRVLVESSKTGNLHLPLLDSVEAIMTRAAKSSMAGERLTFKPEEWEPMHNVMGLYESLLRHITYKQYNVAAKAVNDKLDRKHRIGRYA